MDREYIGRYFRGLSDDFLKQLQCASESHWGKSGTHLIPMLYLSKTKPMGLEYFKLFQLGSRLDRIGLQ